MKNLKRIMAWIGIFLLAALYLITFFLGIAGSEATRGLFMACIICTVVLPCLMYAMILLAKVLGNPKPLSEDTPDSADKKNRKKEQ